MTKPKQSKHENKGAQNQLKIIERRVRPFNPYPPLAKETPVIAPIKEALTEMGSGGKRPSSNEKSKSVKAPEKPTIKLSMDESGNNLELTIRITRRDAIKHPIPTITEKRRDKEVVSPKTCAYGIIKTGILLAPKL